MTLDFGRGTCHAEQFCGKVEGCTIVEHNIQRTTILRKADFNWPRWVAFVWLISQLHFGNSQDGRSFTIKSFINAMEAGKYDNSPLLLCILLTLPC